MVVALIVTELRTAQPAFTLVTSRISHVCVAKKIAARKEDHVPQAHLDGNDEFYTRPKLGLSVYDHLISCPYTVSKK